MPSNKDKRKSPRLESFNLVSFTAFNDEGVIDANAYTRTLNLSEDGMLMEMHRAPPLSSVVNMDLGLEEEIIKIQGKIIRLEEQKNEKIAVGISFIHLNKNDQKILDRYLTKKSDSKNKTET